MVKIRKEDLEKIWSCLSQRVDHEDVEWLIEKRPGLFSDGPNFPKKVEEALKMLMAPNAHWRSLSDSKMLNLSCTIQDVLDAKRKEDTMGYKSTNGLPKKYLIQMTEMLKLKVPENTPGIEIATLVLREI